MKEDELILTHHVGEVINILQMTTHHLFDPDDLLTVRNFYHLILTARYGLIMQWLNESLIFFAGGI